MPTEEPKTKTSKNSVSHLVTKNVPVIHPDQTISDVQKLLYDKSHHFPSINYVYVVDEKNVLVGVFSIKMVFTKPKDTIVKDIMTHEMVKGHPTLDAHKAARRALRHNIKALPIVSEVGELQGVLTNDQILTIVDEEHEKMLYRMSGFSGKIEYDDETTLPVLKSFKKRAPWILIGLVGGTVTANVIGAFDHVLEENIMLAFFIPLMAYIANAVANQTQTIFIRDLAVQRINNIKKYYIKQLVSSLMIAITCLVLLILITTVFWGETEIGLVVGLSMTAAIMTATALGLLVPQILNKLNIDPAVGAGPFATVIQDFLSITIYFTIAEALLL